MGFNTRANDWSIAMTNHGSRHAKSISYMLRSKAAGVAAAVTLVETDTQNRANDVQAATAEYSRKSRTGITSRSLVPIKERFNPFCLKDLHCRKAKLTYYTMSGSEVLLIWDYFRHFFPYTYTYPGKAEYGGVVIVPELGYIPSGKP